jgi:NAD(P)-dependent dehydrogenase (short-subunit alcohol dehydrogenase family)
MTKVLSLELSPYIQVNSIAPGAILKPIKSVNKKIHRSTYNSEKALDSLINSVELLINSDFLSGESINIDNGERLI